MATVLRAGASEEDRYALGTEAFPVPAVEADGPTRRRLPIDALVIDASLRQALVATRSLGRSGLRVGTAESPDLTHPRLGAPAFASRWSEWNAALPSFHGNPDTYARSVLEVAGNHKAQVVMPSIDGSIAALRPWRSRFEGLGVALAMP
jgi:hypothetical protein